MDVDPHDVWEALIQAPGEQLLELGDEIERWLAALGERDDVSPTVRDPLEQEIRYFSTRMRQIAPLIEKLQEVAEQSFPAADEDCESPTAFMRERQPPFAAILLTRLAAARAAGDLVKAGVLRDDIALYVQRSSIVDVREALLNGLRRDSLDHGETEASYVIPSLDDLRKELSPGL